MMSFQEFLATISDSERDFIANLDYGQDSNAHRKAIDQAIANGGVVETAAQGVWFPLEVFELGKNWLQRGHEREFALCMGIILRTGFVGDEADQCIEHQIEYIKCLPEDLRAMLEDMLMTSIEECEQAEDTDAE